MIAKVGMISLLRRTTLTVESKMGEAFGQTRTIYSILRRRSKSSQ